VNAPALVWDVAEPSLALDAATVAALASAHPVAQLWVRQVGSFATSDPLLLASLA